VHVLAMRRCSAGCGHTPRRSFNSLRRSLNSTRNTPPLHVSERHTQYATESSM